MKIVIILSFHFNEGQIQDIDLIVSSLQDPTTNAEASASQQPKDIDNDRVLKGNKDQPGFSLQAIRRWWFC